MRQIKSISKNVHPLKDALEKFTLDRVLYVPIEVAKFSHTACVVNFFGDVIRQPFEFVNSNKGVKFFLREIEKSIKQQSAQATFIGMEASGEHHVGLTLVLQRANLNVTVINPLDSWRERENFHSKNDIIDLGPIARVLIGNKGSRSHVPEGVYYQLFRATRTRYNYIRLRAACKNRITSVVDRIFPGYWNKHDPLFSDKWGKASLLILRRYPAAHDIIKLGTKRLANFLKKHNTKLGLAKAEKIVERAQDALTRPYEDLRVDLITLECFLNDYDNACQAIGELEPHIAMLLVQTPGVYLLSIPGIGLTHAGDFTGAVGDITRFSHYSQVIALAGHPSRTNDSGDWKSEGGPMTKKGKMYLRTILNQISLSLNRHCEDFSNYYTRKFIEKEGRPGIAKVATGNKYIRIGFAIMSREELYRPPKLSRDPKTRDEYYRNAFRSVMEKLQPHISSIDDVPQECYLIRMAEKYNINLDDYS